MLIINSAVRLWNKTMLGSQEEKILNSLMNVVSDRQQMLANNLTNVNTPGYGGRRDIDFASVMTDLKGATPGQRIDINRIIEKASFTDEAERPSYEKEMAAMFENQLKYVILTRINGHIYQHLEEATQAGRAG